MLQKKNSLLTKYFHVAQNVRKLDIYKLIKFKSHKLQCNCSNILIKYRDDFA